MGGGWLLALPEAMSLLFWNCRGLGNPRTENELVRLIQAKDPSVVFRAETWTDEAKARSNFEQD